ncbi:L,D-transpeptidase [Streptomyces sp. PR69]|uniref:L,D-transpeptidase n=1 Tax=Streptomyces sp. PR69 TaxID=2984950 RepID=UPI0022656465|nr:Ig-like domain-containing protein [Streptomyces sp. PR69]
MRSRQIRGQIRVGHICALLAVAALTATGCSASADTPDGESKAKAKTDAAQQGAAARQVAVTVTPQGERAAAGEPVRVTAETGALTSVTVTDGKGRTLAGTTSADGRTWTSDRVAAPGVTYTVKAETRAEDGRAGTAGSSFTTAPADKVNKVDWRPGDGATVGVAQPISLVFDHPVKNKAAVEKQLKVTTSNNTEGSWGWLTDWSGKDRVDWRPKEYFEPGTKVTLDARLDGVDSGEDGGWFVRDYKVGFTVGARQIVKVDLDGKQLTLERDGTAVRRIPVSGGTPGGDKRSWRGTAVLMSKEGTIRMNSETVGLGSAYDKMVDYSMRLTWSGMYAHAAPWNAKYLGKANRSSGCIGMSDPDAAWLYGQVRIGDPFEIKGADTKGTVAPHNGLGVWNVDWADWQAKSALR